MKLSISLIITLFIGNLVYAQFGPQQVISTDALFPRKVAVGDMDGNGTLDILSAARTSNELAWYSNETGIGDFGPLRLISESSENNAIVPGDLDGDGDLDIVSSSANLDIFFWQENLDGLGNFGPQQIIDTVNGAFDVNLSDIDNDGDLDMLGGSFETGILHLYKNDGLGNFDTAVVIGPANGFSITNADLDNDQDDDIIVSTSGDFILGWYRNNDGLGNFSDLLNIGALSSTSSINNFPADLDGDGDIDIISASLNENFGISWYENLDGLGSFSELKLIFTDPNFHNSVFGVDLDNDGDIDVLSASIIDNRIAWYENLDGLGNFGSQQTITTNAISARDVIAADLDNDGDLDVISASQNDSKIAWYENMHILSVAEEQIKAITLTPNPVIDVLQLANIQEFPLQITIISVSGQIILSKTIDTGSLDINEITSGVYFVNITTQEATITKKIIKL